MNSMHGGYFLWISGISAAETAWTALHGAGLQKRDAAHPGGLHRGARCAVELTACPGCGMWTRRCASCATSCSSIPHALMEEMRSSVIFLGALIARCGEARLSLPGGCQLGKRPIDLHLAALRQMGVEIKEDGGEIFCRCRRRIASPRRRSAAPVQAQAVRLS